MRAGLPSTASPVPLCSAPRAQTVASGRDSDRPPPSPSPAPRARAPLPRPREARAPPPPPPVPTARARIQQRGGTRPPHSLAAWRARAPRGTRGRHMLALSANKASVSTSKNAERDPNADAAGTGGRPARGRVLRRPPPSGRPPNPTRVTTANCNLQLQPHSGTAIFAPKLTWLVRGQSAPAAMPASETETGQMPDARCGSGGNGHLPSF